MGIKKAIGEDLYGKGVLPYADDLVIYADTLEECLRILKLLF